MNYYYWHDKSNRGKTLQEELLNVDGVSEVKIATAFLSNNGLSILRKLKEHYKLEKDNIELFISQKFSVDNPHIILADLLDLCIVKIVYNINLHAKVYLIKGKENKVILGSSNLTSGGFENNLEFNCIGNKFDISGIETFFTYCNKHSKLVDKDLIDYYARYSKEFLKIKDVNRKIDKILFKHMNASDAFFEDDYNLEDFYFNYSDYETFFIRNCKESNSSINKRREIVQKKMLAIHRKIYPHIKNLEIFCHKRAENITSLIVPSKYNNFTVAWLGVRYGKSSQEIDELNFATNSKNNDEIYGFQKHACLQYCIQSDGFEINLFFAVKHDAVDRSDLLGIANGKCKLDKLKNKITKEIAKLRGNGMEWVISDNEEYAHEEDDIFNIDNRDPNEFCDFLKRNDKDGRISYLRKYYVPNDERLKTIDTIGSEVISQIRLLLPLYNTMVWRQPLK